VEAFPGGAAAGGETVPAGGGVGDRGVAVAGPAARAAAAAVAGAPGVEADTALCGDETPGAWGEGAGVRTTSQPSRVGVFPAWVAGAPCVISLAGGSAAPGVAAEVASGPAALPPPGVPDGAPAS